MGELQRIIGKKLSSDDTIYYLLRESNKQTWHTQREIEMFQPNDHQQIILNGEKLLRDQILAHYHSKTLNSFSIGNINQLENKNAHEKNFCLISDYDKYLQKMQNSKIDSFVSSVNNFNSFDQESSNPTQFENIHVENLKVLKQYKNLKLPLKCLKPIEVEKTRKIDQSQKIPMSDIKLKKAEKKMQKKSRKRMKSQMQIRQDEFMKILNSRPQQNNKAINKAKQTEQITFSQPTQSIVIEDSSHAASKSKSINLNSSFLLKDSSSESDNGEEIKILHHLKFDECSNLLFQVLKNKKPEYYSFKRLKSKYPDALIEYFKRILLE